MYSKFTHAAGFNMFLAHGSNYLFRNFDICVITKYLLILYTVSEGSIPAVLVQRNLTHSLLTIATAFSQFDICVIAKKILLIIVYS